jgi:hypothetical protein
LGECGAGHAVIESHGAGISITLRVIAPTQNAAHSKDFNSKGNPMPHIFKSTLMIALAIFTALTLYVVTQIGLLNIWVHNLNHPAGWQIFVDIFIALCLFLVWMWNDAKKLNRNFWPWAIFTLISGSFGPLLYLITRKNAADAW